ASAAAAAAAAGAGAAYVATRDAGARAVNGTAETLGLANNKPIISTPAAAPSTTQNTLAVPIPALSSNKNITNSNSNSSSSSKPAASSSGGPVADVKAAVATVSDKGSDQIAALQKELAALKAQIQQRSGNVNVAQQSGEGVPIHIVAAIVLGVFTVTYLFM
ncbi:unnamed protein product, partial [Tilletia controversa]